jgi:uncharacterized Fe-S cluster-containing radical SAM superfamily enzyme
MNAIDNVRKAGLKIVYVPTIVGGVNDDQVPKIVQFALDTIDVCSGISFQPVAITGRIDDAAREKMRFTCRIWRIGSTNSATQRRTIGSLCPARPRLPSLSKP